MEAVVVENIIKKYHQKTALDGISFSVNQSEIFGLIGPDGAGKTTLFRILTTLILADEGKVTVCGHDVVKDYKEIRQIVGYMPGKFSLYQDLTVEENLRFFATVFKTSIEENKHLINDIYVQLEPFKDRRAGKLSGGMKQKLALCCALIHKPKVLFLDEPTTGVDPVSRREFWQMLQKLKQQNIAIVVATPYMDEVAQCDRVALINDGKILSINTPDDMVADYPNELYQIKAKNTYQLIQALKAIDGIYSYVFGEYIHLSVEKNKGFNTADLKKSLEQQGIENITVMKTEPTVEDYFIKILK